MKKLPPWSHTHLSTYDICPKQYYHKFIAKDLPREKTEQMTWGIAVHEGFEQRLKHKRPLPAEMTKYEKYAAALENLPIHVEANLGIRQDGTACDFFAKDVWGRGKADVAVIYPPRALIVDWKTGKRREDASELETLAVLLKARFQEVTTFKGSYVWLQDMAMGQEHDVSATDKTLERVRRQQAEMQHNLDTEFWPEKQGPLCGWCPVISCRFNRRGK